MHELSHHYDLGLVLLSYLVSVLGSYTALQLALNIPLAQSTRSRTGEVLAAGVVMGGGAIWAMHFIAMLACNMGVPVHYDLLLTVASAVLAMLACSVGLGFVAAYGTSLANLLVAGVLMGLGVASMHYLGIAAMVTHASMSFQVGLVVLSVVIAIVASMAALWLAFHLRGALQMVASALVMGVAVCGMHYTGMVALEMQMDDMAAHAPLAGIDPASLGGMIAIVVGGILCVTLALTLARQRQRAALAI